MSPSPSPAPSEPDAPPSRPGPRASRETVITIGIAALCVAAAFFAGRWSASPAPSAPAVAASSPALPLPPPPPRAPPADPMALGLDALYARHDPVSAAARFREVLAQSPDHYGATYQLATALFQAGDAAGSRPVWEKMLAMAEAAQDAPTASVARARLAEIDRLAPRDPDAEDMRVGVQTLYEKHDAAAASAIFRRILGRTPEHYGATFQLATALDQANKPAESRPLWEKVLKMAEAIRDAKTADAARARLAQRP